MCWLGQMCRRPGFGRCGGRGGFTTGKTRAVGVCRIGVGVDELGKWQSPGLVGVDGVLGVTPPPLLLVSVYASARCMADNDEHESLPDLSGSEQGVMRGVMGVGGAARSMVDEEGYSTLALLGSAGMYCVGGCGVCLWASWRAAMVTSASDNQRSRMVKR